MPGYNSVRPQNWWLRNRGQLFYAMFWPDEAVRGDWYRFRAFRTWADTFLIPP